MREEEEVTEKKGQQACRSCYIVNHENTHIYTPSYTYTPIYTYVHTHTPSYTTHFRRHFRHTPHQKVTEEDAVPEHTNCRRVYTRLLQQHRGIYSCRRSYSVISRDTLAAITKYIMNYNSIMIVDCISNSDILIVDHYLYTVSLVGEIEVAINI